MKKLLFMLVLGTVTTAAAFAHNGDKTNNNGDKPDKGAKAKATTRVEEFIWGLPQSSKVEKVEEAEMQKAIVDLYKWYLQNETRVNNNNSIKGDDGQDLVAPFKVDPKVLQQYLKFIKKNFPGLNEDDLSDKRAVTSSVRKNNAPVSTCDDLDTPMSLTASK
ncbi:hypothetical protein ACFOTA_10145 [Chitinophaga sp. GCM10012297]|uniref:Uncharacterized protein n=1 Tax=Chitinophaga chungangae TaxID=2821488 RepID=A0ABS3YD32_9BACT|nr:hypothetical protein [Chitinophaga chungangae]MBO9152566.1 hypothetical protein [Chitinophaga chungangae]